MAETTCSFKCLGHTQKPDGTIDRYILDVTDTRDGTAVDISVEARHLISARSMKRILLGRKLVYSVTQAKHTKMLSEMFEPIVKESKKSSSR
ncbi:hypothetical protein PCL1391_3204 [Pseudomonas chlororaphis subsp. piscium]|nr:hypothetical protein C4K33_3449 [Pseudomonas chlororaphis subsp. piscium]AZC82656.1 hypothetical protein C4K30_3542 [Pseudomonas chlororaphis subsp. piscium]AZC89852.1 hypothetical protein C4K29_3551 [Pseudomonas chlororaphis subsp. piscium]KZO48704.1 hypothetical protein PCL1391_3204 [Pseudomonas chlororaphis subsp. piscium]